jgi:hypothetical protein
MERHLTLRRPRAPESSEDSERGHPPHNTSQTLARLEQVPISLAKNPRRWQRSARKGSDGHSKPPGARVPAWARDVHPAHMRGDWVENDCGHGGRVEHSFFEGCCSATRGLLFSNTMCRGWMCRRVSATPASVCGIWPSSLPMTSSSGRGPETIPACSSGWLDAHPGQGGLGQGRGRLEARHHTRWG